MSTEPGSAEIELARSAPQVFSCLTHLPIAIGERSLDRSLDFRAVERRQRQDGPAAHIGLVGTCRENRRQSSHVTDRAQRRSAGLANECILGDGCEFNEAVEHVVADLLLLAAGPRGNLDHGGVVVGEQRQQGDGPVRPRQLGCPASNLGRRIVEGRFDPGRREHAEAVERPQRGRAYVRVDIGQMCVDRGAVVEMAGDDHQPATFVPVHVRSRFVSQITAKATANDNTIAVSTPVTTPIVPLASPARTRRIGPGRRYCGVSKCSTTTPDGSRRIGPRGERGSALAGLRHPVSTSAAIANAAMNAALTVRPSTESARVTDTQETTLLGDDPSAPPAPRTETHAEAAERAGLATSRARHRWWAIPATVLAACGLVAIAVAGVLPADVVATKENVRLGIDQATPYARTPASAQPVADRIVFGDLGDMAEQYPPSGDIYFVTVTEPEQSLLSWLIGRDDPAIEFLTTEEKYGVQTPQQRRTFALESMRTSEQVAQYIALQRVGFDVAVVPGDVLIRDMVCLVANEEGDECITWSPSDEVLDPGDRILEVAGEPIDGVEDLSRLLVEKSPGDRVEMKIDRPGEGELTVDVELTASPDDPARTIVGFYPFDTRRVELPFELDIDTGSIGGPSAGLAFTLTLIDELTPGELTGGGNVAVTGTMELDGTVGAIGGLRQKASAVAQAGVDVFIVPLAQGEEDIAAARRSGGDGLRIITVETLEDAIQVLESLGGDPIPPPPATSEG